MASAAQCGEAAAYLLLVVSFSAVVVSEVSSRDPFVFSTLRQPRCMEWMALVGLMVTL